MTQLMLIKRNHPIRDAIRGLSTGKGGGGYYHQISHWYDEVLKILDEHDIHVHCRTTPFVYNHQGALVFSLEVKDTTSSEDRLLDSGSFILARYYRMPSGNWEITCRVS
jgi:hypothetical protein